MYDERQGIFHSCGSTLQVWLMIAKYSHGIMLPTTYQVVLDISIGSHFLSLEAGSTMASCETIP